MEEANVFDETVVRKYVDLLIEETDFLLDDKVFFLKKKNIKFYVKK